jgi:hypothetical protein
LIRPRDLRGSSGPGGSGRLPARGALAESEWVERHLTDCLASLDDLIKLFDDAINRNPNEEELKELQRCRTWLASGREELLKRIKSP